MNIDDVKKIINDGAVNTIINDDFDDSKINNILEDYVEIIDDINREYKEKTKKLLNSNGKTHFDKN